MQARQPTPRSSSPYVALSPVAMGMGMGMGMANSIFAVRRNPATGAGEAVS